MSNLLLFSFTHVLCLDFERYFTFTLKVKEAALLIPMIEMDATIRPITRTVLKIILTITPIFNWRKRFHGTSQSWWLVVEDRK